MNWSDTSLDSSDICPSYGRTGGRNSPGHPGVRTQQPNLWRRNDVLAVFGVLAAVFISLLITRIASVALTVTGLSRQSARFQARSAFSGVGFTTSEAEDVVNHPVRRRIVMWLMLIGNAGLITIV